MSECTHMVTDNRIGPNFGKAIVHRPCSDVLAAADARIEDAKRAIAIQAARARQAFAELTTASVSRIEQLTARAEAAEQQAARLNHDLTYLLDVAREVSDGEASRTALRIAVDQIKLAAFRLAASQPAPAVETERACLDCRTPLHTRSVARCYECVERNMLANESNYPRGGQAEGEG